MRIETSSNEYDFGQIRISPNIQDRINQMHRQRAEEQAERQSRIAMGAHREKMRAQAEAERYRMANVALLGQLHAAMGWPKRLMLPAPEVMA